MKYIGLIISGVFLLASSAARAYDVPKDATIKVFDGQGNQIGEMSRAEYKVVKIENNKKVLAERKENKEYKKSHGSVIIHAGAGVTGMNHDTDGKNYKVQEKNGAVGGLTVCKTINKVGLCATGTTNETYMGGLKLDF